MAAEFQDPTLNEQWHNVVPSMTLGKMLEARKHSQPSRKRRKTFVPRTPFMLFVNEVLEKIANDNPDVGPDSVVDLVEQKWKALADAERQAFAEKSELEYKAAAEATALAASMSALSKRRKRNPPIKEVAMPKHPKSAYLHFATLNRDRVKESVSSFADVSKQLGLRWKSIPDEEREVFSRMAEADKLRYRKEKSRYDLAPMKTVESTPSRADAQAAAEPAADAFSGKRRPKHPKAPKHPLSAYLFFVAMHRGHLSARYSDCSFSEVARILGSVWKRVPALEKRKYEILAEADKRNYKFEMHEWNGQAGDAKSSAARLSSSGGTSAASHRERQPKRQQRQQQEHKYKQQQLSPGARDAAQAIADLASSVADSTKPDPPPRKSRPDVSATATTAAAAAAANARRRTLLMYHRDASRVVAGNIVEQSSDASSRARAMALLSSKAFAFFSSSERDAVLQVHPHVDAEELEAALQQMWNELSEHEKTPYMKEAERLLLDDSAAGGGAGAGALPVREWDVVRLGRFVEELGFPAHARSFERLRITGSDVAGLSTSRMKTEIGIRKLGERKRIRAAFDELLQQQTPQTPP